MARGSDDRFFRQRQERKLAVVLANSCRMSRARHRAVARRGGLFALAVPVLLFILGLLAVVGVLREYWI